MGSLTIANWGTPGILFAQEDSVNRSRESLWRTCLLVAGAGTTALGGYHFLLPGMFRWREYVQGAPEPIWAIFAMNAMLSFLMSGGGLATLFIAAKRDRFGATARFITLGMGVFWIFNAAYQVLRPPPFPAPLRIGFLLLAILLALLYAAALLWTRR